MLNKPVNPPFFIHAVMRSPYFFRVDIQQVRNYFKNKSKIL